MKSIIIYPMRLLFSFVLITFFITCWALSLPSLEKSTDELVNLSQRIVSGKNIPDTDMNQAMISAQARRNVLYQQMRTNPGSVVKYLLPEKIVNTLPKQIQPYVEKEVNNVEGTLEIRAALTTDKTEAIQYLLLKEDGSTTYMYFTDAVPANFETGAKIKLNHGFLIPTPNGYSVLLGSSQDFVVSSIKKTAIPDSFGQQRTLAILVNFQNAPTNKPWTLDQVKDVVFNQTNKMFGESSYNQTSVVGTGVGWFTIALNSTDSCDTITNSLPTLAENAARAAGVDPSQYRRRLYFFPRTSSCGWAGLGTIGGNPSRAWFNGYNLTFVTGHEMGHNFGLYHSNFLRCPGSSTEGSCTSVEYGDGADIMGASYVLSHFNSFQKDRLGWLNFGSSPPIQTVTASGNYTIFPYELNNNVKALKILKRVLPNGSRDYYYIEYRQPVGVDVGLGNCGTSCDYTKGVIFHLGNDVTANSSRLIDITPNDSSSSKVALLPGQTYTDINSPNGGVKVTLNSATATSAQVNVTFGCIPFCKRISPTVTVSPIYTQWITSGETARYSVTVQNNDNENCASSRFNLAAMNVPANMKANFSAKTLRLEPGMSETVTVQVASSKDMSTGMYSIGIKGMNADTKDQATMATVHLGIESK